PALESISSPPVALLFSKLQAKAKLAMLISAGCLLLTVLLGLGQVASSLTLQEALQDEARLIHFDQSKFLIWVHALVALAILYGILLFIWSFVTIFMKVTGRTRQRRSYEKEDS
ncbi:hypothetical protein BOX15_Mlig008045g2, partial [Macrostomum lignano]